MGVLKKFKPTFLKNGKADTQNFFTARCLSGVSTRSPSIGGLEFRVLGWGTPKPKIGFSTLNILSDEVIFDFLTYSIEVPSATAFTMG